MSSLKEFFYGGLLLCIFLCACKKDKVKKEEPCPWQSYFTADINGQTYIATEFNVATDFGAQGFTEIYTRNETQIMRFYLSNYKPQVYTLSKNPPNAYYSINLPSFDKEIYETDSANTGTLTITMQEKNRMEGYFSFTAHKLNDTTGTIVNVTNGLFKLCY